MSSAPHPSAPRPVWAPILALAAIILGGLTVWSGGQVLFGPEHYRAAAGNILPVIVWFNFVSGFFYVIAGVEMLAWRASGAVLAALLATALALVWIYFGLHILVGGAYEQRTLLSMMLRLAFWLLAAVLTYRTFKNPNPSTASTLR